MRYYFPINSSALAHYMGSACLKASKYFSNKPRDIQDLVPDFLLLTKEYGADSTDCCLEIVLTENENNEIITLADGWFLFEKPLPISRVVKIHFSGRAQMERTITNIQMSTAIVPPSLLGDIKPFKHLVTDNIKVPSDHIITDHSHEINMYDKILGGLIMMRLVHDSTLNYSEEYISTLAYINTKIGHDLSVTGRSEDAKYASLFTGGEKWRKLLPYLYKNIQDTDVAEMAQKESLTLTKNHITRKIELEHLSGHTYTLAILNSYGVGQESKRMKIDDLIINNFQDSSVIKNDKGLGIALCYGFNRGYSVFNCSYGLSTESKQQVKFELDSQLDYYTVESAYQLAFNHTKGGIYPYLDEWCPIRKNNPVMKKKDYKILDTVIIGKKKLSVFSAEYWDLFFQTINLGDLGKFFKDYLKPKIEFALKDAQDEVREEIESKIHAIEQQLQNTAETLTVKENEISALKKELAEVRSTGNNPASYQNSLPILREPSTPYGTNAEGLSGDLAVKKSKECSNNGNASLDYPNLREAVINEYISLDSLDVQALKNRAKDNGISITPKDKKPNIIKKIMLSPKQGSLIANENE